MAWRHDGAGDHRGGDGAARLYPSGGAVAEPAAVREAVGRGETGGARGQHVFEEDGFRIRTEHFEGFQKWAGVDRVVVRDGMVLIVLGPNANFLPSRLFASNEARREFTAWLLQKLTPEARARSQID